MMSCGVVLVSFQVVSVFCYLRYRNCVVFVLLQSHACVGGSAATSYEGAEKIARKVMALPLAVDQGIDCDQRKNPTPYLIL